MVHATLQLIEKIRKTWGWQLEAIPACRHVCLKV